MESAGFAGLLNRLRITDIDQHRGWCPLAIRDEADQWVRGPGKAADVYPTASVKTLADIGKGRYGLTVGHHQRWVEAGGQSRGNPQRDHQAA